MRAWYVTGMPCPHLPPLEQLSAIRVSLPSRHFDPKIGAEHAQVSDAYLARGRAHAQGLHRASQGICRD